MSKTNEEARKLCPRTCGDCCCQEHHWGDYGPDRDDDGVALDEEETYVSCKHCPARLDYTEKCTHPGCGKELIDHDLDTWSCDGEAESDGEGRFEYAGQPKRECNVNHPGKFCVRCKCCDVVWANCTECGGEGFSGAACIDDMCHGQEECLHGDETQMPCHICDGSGGSYICGGSCCEHGKHKDEAGCTDRCKAWREAPVDEF